MENAKSYAPQILVGTENLPREQWLEYRRKGIGGSDAAAVLGISPFRTGRDLYAPAGQSAFAGTSCNRSSCYLLWQPTYIPHFLEDSYYFFEHLPWLQRCVFGNVLLTSTAQNMS